MTSHLTKREADVMRAYDNPPDFHFLAAARNIVPGRLRVALMSAVIVLLPCAVPAGAQEPEPGGEPIRAESKVANPDNGQVLARKLCVGCHLIEKATNGSIQTEVPSFPSIADRPSQSVEALTNWLIAPHAPMPDPHLSRKEVRDIAGYIIALRTAE